MFELEHYIPVDKQGEPCEWYRERCASLLKARGYKKVNSLSVGPGEYTERPDGSLVWMPLEEE